MTVGLRTRLSTAAVFAVVAYNLFLSTTHVHNNRAYLLIVLAALAVTPCGRELSVDAWWRRRSGRPALPDDVTGLAAVAAALRGGDGLRRVGPEQARRPRLVRRRGHVAPRRADAAAHRGVGAAGLGDRRARRPLVPHGRGQADRGHRAVHRRSGCGGGGPGMRRCGSPSASMSPSNCQPASRCSPTWRSPPSSSGRCRRRATGCSWSTARRAPNACSPAPCGRSTGWPASASRTARPAPHRASIDRDGTARTVAARCGFALSRLPVTAWFALPTLLLRDRSASGRRPRR